MRMVFCLAGQTLTQMGLAQSVMDEVDPEPY
jgi:hypothetical protein